VLIVGFVAAFWAAENIGEILGLVCALCVMYVLFSFGRALRSKFDDWWENRVIRRGSRVAFNNDV
jgi:hypothetical protein